MAQDARKAPKFADYMAALYDDPVRPDTARRGRWLVGISLSLLFILHFEASLLTNEAFPISFPKDSRAVPVALAVVTILLAIEFALRALMDAYRELEFQLVVTQYVVSESLKRQERRAKEIDADIAAAARDDEDSTLGADEWWAYYADLEALAARKLRRFDERLGERKTQIAIRAIRLWLEVAVPLLLAILAIEASLFSALNGT